MNEIVTREELSKLIHISIDSLRKFISRGVIVEISKDVIDLNDQYNKNYIISYCKKKGIDAEVLIYQNIVAEESPKKEVPKQENKKDVSTKSKKSYSELVDEKLEKEIIVKEVDAKLKNLEFDKKKAKVMPTEFVIEIIQRYLNGTCGAIVNSGNAMIDDICKEFKIENKDRLKLKKRLKAIVSDTVKSKHQPVTDEVIEYAKEYALMIKW
jgi:hypothetical protein